MQNPLKQIVKAQKEGRAVGIYSCCSANEYVIRAALLKGKKDNSCVLIESTANQCDQYGGYTGMKPADFKAFVEDIAKEIGFAEPLSPKAQEITSLNEEEAMKEADELIRCYVSAGFTKIHIDTSMRVKDDDVNTRLSDETIARRGARLAKVAEEAYAKLLETNPDAIEPVYIVGSEVPIPGGAQGAVDEGVQVTKPEDFKATLNTFEKAFKDNGLDHAWSNVIGIVVQPGVEEKDSGCTEYDRAKAVDLCAAIRDYDNIVFEGHSTDYQTKIKLREMVEDGIAILKVGPGFTFMMRQALFALADIENELLKDKASHFKDVLDAAMLKDTKYWSKHYIGTEEEVALKRKYSFSDRCRYYMPVPEVKQAMQTMIQNLRTNGIPLNLLTQYMPIQYTRVREGLLENDPEALIVDRICDSIDEYLYATHQSELF